MKLIFGDMTKKVNIFNLEKYPYDMDDPPFEVNFIEDLTSEHSEEIKLEAECDAELESEDFQRDEIVNSTTEWTSSPSSLDPAPTSLIPPSIESSPSLKLKTLPKYLKYAYLSEQETLPAIVASDLTNGQEDDLMTIFRKHRKAIGWRMTDIKGLSLAIVQHRMQLNEEAKLKDPQRRLNSIMQEAVRAEIVKLLNNEIIYPISDNQWVSLVHAVPKKFGFTVVENEN